MATIEPRGPEADMAADGGANGSFLTSVHRVFEAGERLLFDQAALVRLESGEKLAALATRFGLVAAGCMFLLTAWLGLVATAIVAFDGVPLAWRVGVAAVGQLVIGIALLVAARRSPQGEHDA
jgi:putative superfamily III holin-X